MKFKAINKNSEFIRGYRKGTSSVTPLFVSYVLKNRYGHTRIGITASKKVGCAVKRNRARRVIREALRSLDIDMSKNIDIILVARSKTAKAKSYEVAPLLKKRLSEAGVIDA